MTAFLGVTRAGFPRGSLLAPVLCPGRCQYGAGCVRGTRAGTRSARMVTRMDRRPTRRLTRRLTTRQPVWCALRALISDQHKPVQPRCHPQALGGSDVKAAARLGPPGVFLHTLAARSRGDRGVPVAVAGTATQDAPSMENATAWNSRKPPQRTSLASRWPRCRSGTWTGSPGTATMRSASM